MEENEFTDIEKTLEELKKIPEYLKQNLGRGNNDEIYKSKSSEATYYSTKIQFGISKKLVEVMTSAKEVMTGVKEVVKASDFKTKRIFWLTAFLLLIAGWTLWVTVKMINHDEKYKAEMLKETSNIARSINELDSFVLSQKFKIVIKGQIKYLINDTVCYELREIKKIP